MKILAILAIALGALMVITLLAVGSIADGKCKWWEPAVGSVVLVLAVAAIAAPIGAILWGIDTLFGGAP